MSAYRCANKKCKLIAPLETFLKSPGADPICPKCGADAFDANDGEWPCEGECKAVKDDSLTCWPCYPQTGHPTYR